jgi:hypothetical protein
MKNIILKSITGLAILAFFTAGSCMDNPSPIPAIIVLASIGWVALYSLANFEGGRNEKKM